MVNQASGIQPTGIEFTGCPVYSYAPLSEAEREGLAQLEALEDGDERLYLLEDEGEETSIYPILAMPGLPFVLICSGGVYILIGTDPIDSVLLGFDRAVRTLVLADEVLSSTEALLAIVDASQPRPEPAS